MKKVLLCLLLLLPLVVTTSCGDDEPGGLSGKWEKNDLVDEDSKGYISFEFKGNEVTYTEKWSEPGYEDDIEVYKGTYIADDVEVHMNVTYTYSSGSKTEDWDFEYSIDGKKLTLTPTGETKYYFGSAPITLKKK